MMVFIFVVFTEVAESKLLYITTKTINKIIMLEKDKIKVQDELINFVTNKLINEFVDSAGRPVNNIEKLTIIDIDYDEEHQNRKKIIVKKFIMDCRLFVKWEDDSTSSLNTQFRNNKPIEFEINFESDEIELIESDMKLIEEKLF